MLTLLAVSAWTVPSDFPYTETHRLTSRRLDNKGL